MTWSSLGTEYAMGGQCGMRLENTRAVKRIGKSQKMQEVQEEPVV